MTTDRPDLSRVDPAIIAYIEALEAELAELRQSGGRPRSAAESDLEPAEPPTTLNVISISNSGLAKRTPRHFYTRQRRGGMGIFDLETTDDDPPARLLIADESDSLLMITNHGRVFKLAVRDIPESSIRGRGQLLTQGLPLDEGEDMALLLPHHQSGYLNLLTRKAELRRLRHHFFGESMAPGKLLYDARTLGAPVAACWTDGAGDVLVATRQGKAIRFSEDKIPLKGCQAIRLADGDVVIGIAGVSDASGVFLLTGDGKGTIRLMSGFTANKAPGAGGKVAIKSDDVTAIAPVTAADDIFIISQLSKIIRFQAEEVPAKEGVVQGVNCMALRSDSTVALTIGQPVA
jgi:DNA gyrase subunit A